MQSIADVPAGQVAISAPTLLETAIVLNKRGVLAEIRSLLADLTVEIVAFDESLAWRAFAAHQRFGKGNHPAGLNFGDCFSYALAVSRDAPLLFKGEDFAKTDVRRAL